VAAASAAAADAASASRDPKTALLAELYAAELQMQQINYELGAGPGGSAGGSRTGSGAE
jgi:hypothetical protein